MRKRKIFLLQILVYQEALETEAKSRFQTQAKLPQVLILLILIRTINHRWETENKVMIDIT